MRLAAIIFAGFILYAAVRITLSLQLPNPIIDDAYITLRYAENLVESGSLTYNVGDKIYGISTILYVFILAIVKFLIPQLDLVIITIGVNIFLEYLCLLVLTNIFFLIGAGFFEATLLSIASLWNATFLSSSQGGMETPLYVLWGLLALMTIDRSVLSSGIYSGMALLTRPEGCIPLALTGLINFLRGGKKIIYLVICLFICVYLLFFYFGYGTFYPSSVEAKSLLPPGENISILKDFSRAFHLIFPLIIVPKELRLFFVLAISSYGIWNWPLKWSKFFALGIIILNIVLYLIAKPPIFFWYPAFIATLLAIFFFWGLWKLCRSNKWLLLIVVSIFVFLDVKWVYFTKESYLDSYTTRLKSYRILIKKLQEEEGMTPQDSIMTHEIGVVGYYTKARIYDTMGLINPSLIKLGIIEPDENERDENPFSQTHGLVTIDFLKKTSPDWIIIQKNFIATEVFKWPSFKDNYSFFVELPDTEFTKVSGNIQVYKKIKK